MSSNVMLDQIRADIRAALTERETHQATLDSILAKCGEEARSDLTTDEQTSFTTANEARKAADAKRSDLEARLAELEEIDAAANAANEVRGSLPKETAAPKVDVRSEPLTYREGGPDSYFRDLARAHAPGGDQDQRSIDRLSRHAKEMQVEARADMNRTDGTGGEFVPPLWLVDQYIALARAGRITADLCRRMPLPAGTDSINIPSVATGTATAEQADGGSVQRTDMTTSSKAAAVTTVAGQQVFAMQLLDQSPINMDAVVFGDLMSDLATKVDAYVLNKASIGILNVTGINAITYTDASPTVPEAYPKFADAILQVHTGRFLPPQAHVMHPRRWAWMVAALDSSNRPLVVPSEQGPQNAFAGMDDVRSEGSVGSLQGLPVYVDSNVPVNLGAGTNEDRVITARFDDLYLWESNVRSRVLFETDADTLEVRLQVWEYLAFMGNRYPDSISVISGTGLITPTF